MAKRSTTVKGTRMCKTGLHKLFVYFLFLVTDWQLKVRQATMTYTRPILNLSACTKRRLIKPAGSISHTNNFVQTVQQGLRVANRTSARTARRIGKSQVGKSQLGGGGRVALLLICQYLPVKSPPPPLIARLIGECPSDIELPDFQGFTSTLYRNFLLKM